MSHRVDIGPNFKIVLRCDLQRLEIVRKCLWRNKCESALSVYGFDPPNTHFSTCRGFAHIGWLEKNLYSADTLNNVPISEDQSSSASYHKFAKTRGGDVMKKAEKAAANLLVVTELRS